MTGAVIPGTNVWVPTDTPPTDDSSTLKDSLTWLATTAARVNQTLYVDAVNGSNANGIRGRANAPFQTIAAAVSAALFGDVIHVGRGLYQEENLLKAGGSLTPTVAARASNIVTLTVGSGHGLVAGDRVWVVTTNPTSGQSITGEWVVSAVTSTTISFAQYGSDATITTTANDRVLKPLTMHLEEGAIIGYPSGTARTLAIFDAGASGINGAFWLIIRGHGSFQHTYLVVSNNAVVGSRLDANFDTMRNTSSTEVVNFSGTNSSMILRFADGIYAADYDAVIISSGLSVYLGGPVIDAGPHGNAIETGSSGTLADLRVDVPDLRGGDDTINLAGANITRGHFNVRRITNTNTGLGVFYQAGSSSNITFHNTLITSAATHGVGINGKGARFLSCAIQSTKNDASLGAAVAFLGSVSSGFPIFSGCTFLSHSTATRSIQSTAGEAGVDNTAKIYGGCVANKAVQTPNVGTDGVTQQVGTVTVDANVS